MEAPVPSGPLSADLEITARLNVAAFAAAELLPHDDSRPDLPLARVPSAVTAFVGRTLKGPVGEPTRVTSFSQFQQHFGGLWLSSTLGYALEQFFDNGGEEAIVVRVVSGGRSPTLDLACGPDVLTLEGRCPGSREFLRASVDYDSLPEDPTQFNLVIQRVRSPGSELVEEQEIHRRLSSDPSSARFVTTVLDESRLLRVAGPVPIIRPDITLPRGRRALIGYANCNADGDDGEPLNDYDVIGNEQRRTGLFALHGAGPFSLLCVPPLERDRDVGMSVLVVAARLCRQRHALLVVDSPQEWTTAAQAIDGMRRWPFHTQDAVMYFPRVVAQDRLQDRSEVFAPCGAVAGLLARRDRLMPVWQAEEGDSVPLRPSMRPAVGLADDERVMLATYGLNTFGPSRGEANQSFAARSLAATLGAALEPRLLAGRRLALLVIATVERGTRWVLYGTADSVRRQRVTAQVITLLEGLAAEGAFAHGEHNTFVICDDRLNGASVGRPGEFRLLFGYAPMRDGEFQAWLTTHRPGGSQTRAVTVNRLATFGDQVAIEIQTSILRGLNI